MHRALTLLLLRMFFFPSNLLLLLSLSLSSCRMQAQGGVSAKGVGIYCTVIDTWVRPRMSATL
jgi:hypothetical protein